MSLKRVIHTDEEGRKKIVLLPEEASEEEAEKGILVGPPSLEELGLPIEIEVRLNNELFYREILTPQDALGKRSEILASLQATLRIDTDTIVGIYIGKDFENAKREESTEKQSDTTVHNRRPRQPR